MSIAHTPPFHHSPTYLHTRLLLLGLQSFSFSLHRPALPGTKSIQWRTADSLTVLVYCGCFEQGMSGGFSYREWNDFFEDLFRARVGQGGESLSLLSAHTHTHTHKHKHTYTQTHKHKHTNTHTHTHTQTQTHKHTNTQTHTHIHTHKHTHTNTHTYIHTQTHTHIYIYIYICEHR